MYPFQAPPSTRMLTATKWITVGISVLLLGLGVLWVTALVAGFGQRWARVLCTVLLIAPMGVIAYGVSCVYRSWSPASRWPGRPTRSTRR